MSVAKISVSLDSQLLNKIDGLIRDHLFTNRSQVIQAAVSDKVARLEKTRLLAECARLNPLEEQALADEGLASEIDDWPVY